MGQIEVLDWLRREASFDSEKRFSIKEIIKGLEMSGKASNGSTEQSVRRAVNKLSHFGFIDCETIGWFRKFKYVEGKK